jgi:hypothetical protein
LVHQTVHHAVRVSIHEFLAALVAPRLNSEVFVWIEGNRRAALQAI